jgi:hypothetical protein
MPEMISGGCLCGKVSFELINDFMQFHLCHCTECRKITGSAHASNLFANPKNINWLRGVDNIKRYDYPNGDLTTAFCADCGSCVPYLTKNGKWLVVPAGSLNENPSINPQDNIFWSERAGWYDEGLAAIHYEAFPD